MKKKKEEEEKRIRMLHFHGGCCRVSVVLHLPEYKTLSHLCTETTEQSKRKKRLA